MFYYLLIGLIVQCVITLSRMARGVVPSLDFKGFSEWLIFAVTFIVGAIVNALVWPATIVFEIINVKNGV